MGAALLQLTLLLLLISIDDTKNMLRNDASTFDWRRSGIIMCVKLVPSELCSVYPLTKVIQQSVTVFF